MLKGWLRFGRNVVACECLRGVKDEYELKGEGRCQSRSTGRIYFCKPLADKSKEPELLKACASDWIVGVVDECSSHIVLELLRRDLLLYVNEMEGPLMELEVLIILQDILNAVKVVHEKGYVHGDIKPENLVLNGDNLDSMVNVKLIDFDNSRAISDTQTHSLKATPNYLAPDVAASGETSRESDIWCVGAVAYFLLVGESLISSQLSTQEIFEILDLPSFPYERLSLLRGEISDKLYSLLETMLSKDPKKRPTANSALETLSSIIYSIVKFSKLNYKTINV
jgi:serine/threonine protein kinase